MNKKILHSVFENQALRVPENIAIQEENASIMYGELNSSANKLAHLLLKVGVKRDSIVGVILTPGISLVTTLLSIFKSGGVYLPLDISFSATRLIQILTQCAPEVIITTVELKEQVIHHLFKSGISPKYLIVIKGHNQFEVFL